MTDRKKPAQKSTQSYEDPQKSFRKTAGDSPTQSAGNRSDAEAGASGGTPPMDIPTSSEFPEKENSPEKSSQFVFSISPVASIASSHHQQPPLSSSNDIAAEEPVKSKPIATEGNKRTTQQKPLQQGKKKCHQYMAHLIAHFEFLC